ncbi:MAG: alpha/beta hydrolase fold protein [Segetibacter sp.]|nr:alpha/beta hydrolase fold protein [Segetibacter sp.]
MRDILARNNVLVFGEGQPMLFAHGFGCDLNMWRFVTPAFEKQYKIILFDYVGSGKSDMTAYNVEKYNDLNGYAKDILDIVAALDLNNIIFVGHSVSCMIGLLASIKQPNRFSKMIFIGPSARYINEAPSYVGGFEKKDIEELLETMDKNYIGWANFLAPAIMKNPDRPELGEELAESFCSTDPIIAMQFAEVTFLSDNREDLSKINIPTLILQCSDDLIAPLEVGSYLQQQIKGSTLKIMKATGHCPHMSAPGETIDLISDYLTNAN